MNGFLDRPDSFCIPLAALRWVGIDSGFWLCQWFLWASVFWSLGSRRQGRPRQDRPPMMRCCYYYYWYYELRYSECPLALARP
ncbi:hypothetical protein BJX68DRAFT_119089 [Aspergillus pseudodeflectus]|uniref:Uncharacterized protein n=1 Tax=Aspergillus pseudodeflectus TaxID=176178 RepID=A0ABR4L5B8_9EURO